MRRRTYIATAGTALTLSIAGCTEEEGTGNDDGGTTDEGDDNASTQDEQQNDTDNGNGGDGEDQNGTSDESDGDEGENGGDEVVDEPDTIELSGSGATVEDGIDIQGGLTAIEASHTGGESNFQVHLVPAEGEFDALFVNEIGEYEGTTADMLETDTYQVDVEADGDWQLTIRQPRATSGDSLPQSLSGNNPDFFGPFEFGGSHTASGSHSGDGNFQLLVYPPEGQFGELVFNEVGEYDGETTFRADGVGYVDVNANGEWSVDLE